jgi:hypothetical protein
VKEPYVYEFSDSYRPETCSYHKKDDLQLRKQKESTVKAGTEELDPQISGSKIKVETKREAPHYRYQ